MQQLNARLVALTGKGSEHHAGCIACLPLLLQMLGHHSGAAVVLYRLGSSHTSDLSTPLLCTRSAHIQKRWLGHGPGLLAAGMPQPAGRSREQPSAQRACAP